MEDRNKYYVLQIQQGCDVQKNYEILYKRNIGIIQMYIKMFLQNKEDYDDLKQQAFLSLVKAVEQYKREAGYCFVTYLKVCLKHDFYEYNRHFKHCFTLPTKVYRDTVNTRDTAVSELPYDELLSSQELSGLSGHDSNEVVLEKSFLDSLQNSLEERDFRIIYEHFYQSKNLAEIGRELGLSRESVRVHNKKALMKIKKMLAV